MLDPHAADAVGEGVDEHGDVEPGPAQRVGDGALVAEVGERDEDAVDLVAVALERVGAELRLLEALDGAVVRRVGGRDDGADAGLLKHLEDCLAPRRAEVVGEEAAVADDDA